MKSTVNEDLKMLLKEVLRNTRPEDACKLSQAHRAGKVINVSIARSKYGDDHQCAFQWFVTNDNRSNVIPPRLAPRFVVFERTVPMQDAEGSIN